MEKRIATYDLAVIKLTFATVKTLRITASALRDARAAGFSREDIVNTIAQLKSSDFVKSMTTYASHQIWQDVYNTEFNGCFLYIKYLLFPSRRNKK